MQTRHYIDYEHIRLFFVVVINDVWIIENCGMINCVISC